MGGRARSLLGRTLMATAAIKRFWSRVAGLGCAVHGEGCGVHIAHVAGKPSVVERIKEPKAKGKKLARMDYLVVGLCPELHYLLDYEPQRFETEYGPVAKMVDTVAEKTGVDVWALSQRGRK